MAVQSFISNAVTCILSMLSPDYIATVVTEWYCQCCHKIILSMLLHFYFNNTVTLLYWQCYHKVILSTLSQGSIVDNGVTKWYIVNTCHRIQLTMVSQSDILSTLSQDSIDNSVKKWYIVNTVTGFNWQWCQKVIYCQHGHRIQLTMVSQSDLLSTLSQVSIDDGVTLFYWQCYYRVILSMMSQNAIDQHAHSIFKKWVSYWVSTTFKTRGPRGVAHLRKRSKVKVEPFPEDH